ncbi:hypothetical protein F5880DRAFT_169584 [Lentinula raphanica]|nr:hypothetical protein F5880DRAFT_169584 [Lentinula raphanica]
MSYYHHGGEFQPDHTLPTEQTDFIPGWETIDQPQQHQAPQESPSSSTFVSPAVSTPHALPPQQFEYSPLTPTLDYGEMPDVPFPNPAGTTITFAPHERLVRSEGYPSPETEAFQHSPSPTTPSASGPQRTHTRATGSQGSGSGSKPHHLHRPYTRRSQSALAGKTKEATGARFSVVGAGSGIQAYPASMSMPTQEMGTSHASPSTMLPPSITRPQRPSLIPTSTSSHQPMGPPLEPPRSAIALPPEPTDLRSAQATQVPSPATGSGVASFEAIIQKVRSVKKHFFTPRLDTFYDTDSHVLRAYIELPGVRRNNLRVTLATSAITRHRNVSVWGISLSPAWLPTGSAQAGTSQTVGAVGTTIQSGSLSSTSAGPSIPSLSAGAAGTAPASSAPSPESGSGGVPLRVTTEMELSLGLGLPPQYSLRERRYGEFYRILPVPPETRVRFHLLSFFDSPCLLARSCLYLILKRSAIHTNIHTQASDIQAVLDAGVLSLSISFGTLLTQGQVSSITENITVG